MWLQLHHTLQRLKKNPQVTHNTAMCIFVGARTLKEYIPNYRWDQVLLESIEKKRRLSEASMWARLIGAKKNVCLIFLRTWMEDKFHLCHFKKYEKTDFNEQNLPSFILILHAPHKNVFNKFIYTHLLKLGIWCLLMREFIDQSLFPTKTRRQIQHKVLLFDR